MFGKKSEKIIGKKADSGILFTRTDVSFFDFRTYCSDFTRNGDWVIPLGSIFASAAEYEPGESQEDTTEVMREYDDDLVSVYRHQDDQLVKKNVRMLGYSNDPKKKGLMFSIEILMDKTEKLISKFNRKKVEALRDKMQAAYDSKMKDKTTGQEVDIHIWIPVWRKTAERAMLISIIDRIYIVVT